ncbi:MAG: HRDC domain-containing protein [Acidimicrobiales bacterium]|nr:HRDC domain-containing protein [Acidimicrobiales bacterium]
MALANRVIIDETVLRDPGPAVAALREAWMTRTPVTIDMRIDPATFRPPESYAEPPWTLGPKKRAQADGLRAYVILNDTHLAGIAERHPTSLEELRMCPGMGPAKLESFGDEIIEVPSTVTDNRTSP